MDQAGGIILLIDDNKIDIEVNTKLLQKSNCADQVIAYTSAVAGLHFLHTCAQHTKIPDLILLDIYMPEMDGFQFLEQYQHCPEDVVNGCTVVMISSSRDELDLNRAHAHPLVQKAITKPLNPAQVQAFLG